MAIDFDKHELEYESMSATRDSHNYQEPPIVQRHGRDFVNFVARHYKPGDRVLDIGCGRATLWPHYKKLLQDPAALVCIDLSDGKINEARHRYPKGDFRVGGMLNIPADAGEFDIVIVSNIFHYVPEEGLPQALNEVHRVLEEHGRLIGREPLRLGRLTNRGGWLSGALMSLRQLAYHLTHARGYRDPNPGSTKHRYALQEFLKLINHAFRLEELEIRNAVSMSLGHTSYRNIAAIARMLDESAGHKAGQELHYLATKNYKSAADVEFNVRMALEENHITDIPAFLALVEAATTRIEAELGPVK